MNRELYSVAAVIYKSITKNDTTLRIDQVDHRLTTIPASPEIIKTLLSTNSFVNTLTDNIKLMILDKRLTLSDFPSMLKLISSVANTINKDTAIVVNDPNGVINVIEIIITVVLQMALPEADFDVMKTFCLPAFDLLRTRIEKSGNNAKSWKQMFICNKTK
jgi:hypothetical protein